MIEFPDWFVALMIAALAVGSAVPAIHLTTHPVNLTHAGQARAYSAI